jgi:hypothetical protein
MAMSSSSRGTARGNNADQMTAPIRSPRAAARPVPATPPTTAGWVGYPLFVGFVHLLIVQITGALAYLYGTSRPDSAPFTSPTHSTVPPVHSGIWHWLVDPMRQWDGLWYRLIAVDGYSHTIANAAFWPAFPWSMRGLGDILGISYDTAGWVIANVCFFVALILLYRLVSLDFDPRIGRATLWAIALFPTSLFFSAVYTESPFLMFIVGGLLAARLRQWWLAGILGALAAANRSYGVFLILPYAVLYYQQNGAYIRRWIPRALPVVLPALGPLAFSLELNHALKHNICPPLEPRKGIVCATSHHYSLNLFGRDWSLTLHQPLAWKDVQEQWNRHSAAPWDTLRWAFSSSPAGRAIGIRDGADWSWLKQIIEHPSWHLLTSRTWRSGIAESDTLELVCTLGFLALAVIGLVKLPAYYSAFLIPGLIVPLLQPSSVHVLMSMPRFGLTLFPIFVLLGMGLKSRWVGIPVGVLSAVMLVLLTIQFSQWYWVS